MPIRSGEEHGRAKLTEEDVSLARLAATRYPLHSKRARIVVKLAALFGVHPSTLWRAIVGETWVEVPGAVDRLPKGQNTKR